jgi:hypothetical protein
MNVSSAARASARSPARGVIAHPSAFAVHARGVPIVARSASNASLSLSRAPVPRARTRASGGARVERRRL